MRRRKDERPGSGVLLDEFDSSRLDGRGVGEKVTRAIELSLASRQPL